MFHTIIYKLYTLFGSQTLFVLISFMFQDAKEGKVNFAEFYAITHKKKNKEWIDPICSEKYVSIKPFYTYANMTIYLIFILLLKLQEQMKDMQELGTQSGLPFTPEDISVEVLGRRKGYLRGFGVGPKPSFAPSDQGTTQTHVEQQQKEFEEQLQQFAEQQRQIAEKQENLEEQQKEIAELRKQLQEERKEREEQKEQLANLQKMMAVLIKDRCW